MYQNSSQRKQQGNLSMIIVVLNNEMVVCYIYIFTYIDTWVLYVNEAEQVLFVNQ